MMKTGRNRPCPCGSGKKYKLCCLPADEAAQRQEKQVAAAGANPQAPTEQPDDGDLEHLDVRSNRVVDLIAQGKLDEAEEAANELLRCYPGLMDGDLRLAMVFEARGQSARAADHYRKAAACLDEDGDELRQDLLKQAQALAQQ